MPGIFISYRREDSGGYAQRLFESISSYFGKRQVFMDIDSIEAGADFSEVIRDRIARCDVFVAVIGRTWVRCTDERGHRRLEDPRDFVRLEVTQALGRGMRVIPVLVGGARMPSPEELPADIRPLALHNAYEIPDLFFKQSVRQLVRLLRTSVNRGGWPVPVSRRAVILTAGGFTVLAGGVALTSILSDKAAEEMPSTKPAAGDLPKLEAPSAPHRPPVIVKVPGKILQLPPPVPGPWNIDKLDFAADVIGPREAPHLLWMAPITIGDAWDVVGFAPDETVYVWDKEAGTICGIRNGSAGIEEWAYREPFGFGLDGITPDGRVWLGGSDGAYCFNSKGEGGLIGRNAHPPKLVSAHASSPRKTSGECLGGAVQLLGITQQAIRNPIPVDGNCMWVVQDDLGRFYGATDRGSVYCISAEGAVLWKYEEGTSISSEPLFSAGDPVFAGKDRLFCLRDGVVRWNIQLARCRPRFVDKAGTIYVSYSEDIDSSSGMGSSRPVTAAVDRDGHVIWRLQTEYTALTLDPQGRLFLLGGGGIVCANS